MMELDRISSEIDRMAKRLKLADSVKVQAKFLAEQSLADPDILNSRIGDKSIAVSAIYIALRQEDKSTSITQYDLSYLFGISPMTIRKVYRRLCKSLDIDRSTIVPMLELTKHKGGSRK